MKHGTYAVELLLSDSIQEATKRAEAIEGFNEDRKALDREITEQALAQIEEGDQTDKASTVVYDPDWHKVLIGIVASRLIETYYRPTVVFTKSKGKLTASVRSVKGLDAYSALEACQEYIEQFGGHKYAAGLTIKEEHYENFKKAFENVVNETMSEECKTEVLEVDEELQFSDITLNFYNILKQFEPFGPENRAPLFVTRRVIDRGTSKTVGAQNDHLKLHVSTEKERGSEMNGIAFNMGTYAEYISKGLSFDICYSIEENEWKGNLSIQLSVKDIKTL